MAAGSSWATAFSLLESSTPQQRSEGLDRIAELLQETDWKVPEGSGNTLLAALSDRLGDNNWSVAQKCLQLIGDLLAEPDAEIDGLVRAHLLNQLVVKVSDSKVVVRKAASQALVAYMHSTRDAHAVVLALLRVGLDSADWRQRQATLLFLSLASTPLDGASLLRPELIRSVAGHLLDPIEAVAGSARQALARFKEAFGEADFAEKVRSLPPALRAAYEGGSTEGDGGGDDGLEFGFVPSRLASQLRNGGNFQLRGQAISELQKLLHNMDSSTQQQVVPTLAAFSQLLAGFLDDTNFKISLTSLQMTSDMLDRFGDQIRNGPDSLAIASTIVPKLMEKFADNKIVIRQSNLKLMKKLMGVVPPERVLPPLLEYLQHNNSHIREMAINVLIQTLLSAPRQPIELYRTALAALSSALVDGKPKVKQAALEAVAVLHDAAGAGSFDRLMLEANLDEERVAQIDERLKHGREALPTLSADGLVEFTTQGPARVPSAGAGPRVPVAPSVACSCAEATPSTTGAPDFNDLSEVTAGGRKIRTAAAGRLPWEIPRAVPSRGNGPRLDTAHEVPSKAECSRSLRDSRGMRIEVPASGCGNGQGPLTAPPNLGSPFIGVDALAAGLSGAYSLDGEAADAPFGAKGPPVSPRDQRYLSEQEKVNLWLPGASVDASVDSVPAGGLRSCRANAVSPQSPRTEGPDSPAAGARDSLKLLKRRQGGQSAAEGSRQHVPTEVASELSTSSQRAVSAACKGSMLVRMPFEETKRSSSAPQKRTTAVPPPEERMQAACEQALGQLAERGHAADAAAADAHPPPGEESSDSRAEAACGSVFNGPIEEAAPTVPPYPGALPKRRTSLLRSKYSEPKLQPELTGPVGALPRRAVAAASGGAALSLSLDGVGMNREKGAVREEGDGREGDPPAEISSGAFGGFGGSQPKRAASDRTMLRAERVVRKGEAANGEPAPVGAASTKQPTSQLIEVTSGLHKLEEIRTEDLHQLPLPNDCGKALQLALDQLRGDDWAAQFSAINSLRRLVASDEIESPAVGLTSQLHSLNLLLIQFCDSLRSSLSKNAVVCFREMFVRLGKLMEADVDLIVPMLIKKAGETNGFICEEANRALTAMGQAVSENRAIAALVGCSSHRNPAARAKAALHLSRVVETMGYGRLLQSKDLERVIPVLPTLLSEGLSETRAAGKAIVSSLMREARLNPADLDRLERLLRRHLSDPAYRKLRDSVDSTDQGMMAGGQQLGAANSRHSTEGRRAVGKVGASSVAGSASSGSAGGEPTGGASGSSDEPLERLSTLCTGLGSHDWAVRRDAVSSLVELVGVHGDLFVARGKVLTLFDALTPRFTDSNSKVNMLALHSLQQLIPKIREGMPSVTATLVPALAASLASSNPQVRAISPGVFDTLMAEVDHAALIQPFSSCALYSPPKARPIMIDRLRELSCALYPTKPQLVSKHAVPAAFRLVEDPRSELRACTTLLLRALHTMLGDGLIEQSLKAPSSVQSRMSEMLQLT